MVFWAKKFEIYQKIFDIIDINQIFWVGLRDIEKPNEHMNVLIHIPSQASDLNPIKEESEQIGKQLKFA